jgi:Spy/CpxP family protein refolding chaperone
MKKTLLITAAAMLLLTAGAFAQRGSGGGAFCDGHGMSMGMGTCGGQGMGMGMHDGGRGMGPAMLLKVADKIGLTDQQKKDLTAMVDKFGTERIEKKAALEKAELKLQTLRMNNAPDSDILKAMDTVGQLKTDMQKMRYQHRQAVKGLLTDDQVTKLQELRKDRMGKRGDGSWMGRGMMRDGDGPHGKQGGKI